MKATDITSIIALCLSALSLYLSTRSLTRQYYQQYADRIVKWAVEVITVIRRFAFTHTTVSVKESQEILVRMFDLLAQGSMIIPSRHLDSVQDPIIEFLKIFGKDVEVASQDETHEWNTQAYIKIFRDFYDAARAVTKIDRFG